MKSSHNHILSNPADFSNFDIQWNDLVWGIRAGHMSAEACKGAAFAEWDEYASQATHYVAEKQAIIKGGMHAAERLSGDLTIVSRGPGSKFRDKDGALAKIFELAGCRIAGVVYIDSSIEALKNSIADGKDLFPDAWHCPMQFDVYARFLKYPVVGTEVNTFFGFTMENVEGFVRDGPPKEKYVENTRNIRSQMSPGAHLFTTVDTCTDKIVIEDGYGGEQRNKFARGMLLENQLGHLPLIFAGEYFKKSYMYTHNFETTKATKIPTITGAREANEGTRLHYQSSLKMPLNVKLDWDTEGGHSSVNKIDDLIFDDSGRVPLLHYQNG